MQENNPWEARFKRERKARKESEALLEEKSFELWKANQELEQQVIERTESLKEALLEARNADRAKSEFLANISHEIRTPLNAIIGFSEYLSHSDELSEQSSKYASIIEHSANSLLSIINDILDFSKIQSGKFEVSLIECDLKKNITQCMDLFSHKAQEKEITLELNWDENNPAFVMTDALRLKQILSNLLSNAIKFTNKKGNVTLKVSSLEQKNKRCRLLFEVKDSGIGIPTDKLKAVLDPFVQLENIEEHHVGTGLGLSICQSILNLLHSNLNVTSKPNEGSCFSFELELEVLDEVKEQTEIAPIEKKFNSTILVAEDNLANQELMRLVLEELGVNATIASNGEEVIEYYQNDPKAYALLLMDINMPILSGEEAFKAIRSYEQKNGLQEIPVIALTANAIKGDEEHFLKLGMNGYLSKPIHQDRLAKILSEHLEQKTKAKQKKHPFDHQKIMQRLGVSEKIVEMIIAKFTQEVLEDLQELEGYINDHDFENASQKAHYLRNSCLNLLLEDEARLLEKIEQEKEFKQMKNDLETLKDRLKVYSL